MYFDIITEVHCLHGQNLNILQKRLVSYYVSLLSAYLLVDQYLADLIILPETPLAIFTMMP